MKTLFFDFDIECCKAVWFNSDNFPKTEVGSGKSGAPVQTLENLEMKKTLVAIAALAATGVFAQQLPSGANPSPAFGAGFRIIGGFDASLSNLTYKGGNKFSGVTYNSTSTSQITMVGIEDLGGGLKADFNYESDINPTTQYNTGVAGLNGIAATANTVGSATPQVANATSGQAASTWGNGQVKVGLGGAFGYVALGAVNNAGLDFNQISGPFGTAWGSGYGVTQAAVGNGFGASAKVRYDNSVRYITPDLIAGLRGSLTYRGKNDVAANTQFSTTTGKQALSGVQELAAIYSNGPLNLIFVNQVDDGNGIAGAATAANTATLTTVASGAKYKTNSIGGNYTYGPATVYYGRQTMTNDTSTVDNKTDRFALKYAATPVINVMASYNKLTALNGTTTKVTGIGADYMLSKMTALTFRMDRTDDGAGKLASDQALTSATTSVVGAGFAGGATAADNQRNRTAVGLRMNF
jgi:predicted porin